MIEKQLPRSTERQSLGRVLQIEIRFAVALTLKCENRIRATLNTAVCHACKVNSQEWEFRIRNRIDQVAHFVLGVVCQFVIITPETNNGHIQFHVVLFGQSVCLQTTTENHILAFVRSLVRADHLQTTIFRIVEHLLIKVNLTF